MDLEIRTRVAVVTGGASGIGRASVAALLAEGAHVVILDANADEVELLDQLGASPSKLSVMRCDVTSESAVQRAISTTLTRFGSIDMVLCSAGISGPVGATATDISVEEWDRVMAVNVKGAFLTTKHALPALLKSPVSSVVYIASDAALVGFEGMTPYCTSKGALIMLSKAMSVDFPTVRFNCLCPGVVDTPMSRADLGQPDGFTDSALPVMDPGQLARHALFLLSPISSPVNGTTLLADFGYIARSSLPPLSFSA